MFAQDGSSNVNTDEMVPVADLVVVQSARSTVSDEHVQVLAGAMAELPPILVHRSTMRVIDGYHRVHAARLSGATAIRARFFEGTDAEAFVEAIKQNVAHGLPLSLADRKTAAARLIANYPSWSNRAIARTAGLSDGTVRTLRASVTVDGDEEVRLGRDGRVRPPSTAEGRILAYKRIQSNPDVPLRTVADEAGVSLGTAHDVRERVRRGDHPVPPRQRRALDPTKQPDVPALAEVEDAAGARDGGELLGEQVELKPANVPVDPPARPDASLAISCSERTPQALLEALRRDPALRFTEQGRRVLRWFTRGAMPDDGWRPLLAHVPAHQAKTMAEIARRTAQSWTEFAHEVERLRGDGG